MNQVAVSCFLLEFIRIKAYIICTGDLSDVLSYIHLETSNTVRHHVEELK